MKKVLLMFIAFLALQVNAQEIYFIPKIGVNSANLTNAELDCRLGFNIGMGVEYTVIDIFSVETGLFYSIQGAKGDIPSYANVGTEGYDEITMKYNYLNIPVYAKLYLNKGFYVIGGPQFAINTSSKIELSGQGYSEVGDVDGATRTFDIGLGGGLGYQFESGLSLSVSYTYGFIGVSKRSFHFDPSDTSKETNFHNSVFNMNVGWRF